MDEQSDIFACEARELLQTLEESALQLEEDPDNIDLISEAFRAIHTLKGSGAMFGYNDISDFLHAIETILDLVRRSEVPVTKDLINLLLQTKDEITEMLGESEPDRSASLERRRTILEGFRALVPESLQLTAGVDDTIEKDHEFFTEGGEEEATYRIRFTPDSNLYLRGFDHERLFNEIRSLGWCNIHEIRKEVPEDEFNPDLCYSSWDIIVTTAFDIQALKDIFIFFDEGREFRIDVIAAANELLESKEFKRLGEILIERGDITPKDLEKALKSRELIGEYLVNAGLLSAERVESALFEQEALRKSGERNRDHDNASTIRVPFRRLDALVDLVGELVAAQTSLSQISAEWNDIDVFTNDRELIESISGNNFEVLSRLHILSEQLERLTMNIRETTMNMRMIPIGTTFSRYKRLVRDLSVELDRDVKLLTEGEETEFDKSIIDRLSEPLVHLIRNAVDHGMEPREVRKAAGKDPQGTIMFKAWHEGSYIYISVSDDGRGLDTKKITECAIESGIISSAEGLTDDEIRQLIFEPGLSTAMGITSVSGRGIGMDAVKRNIESLSGNVLVESEKEKGTKFTLKIPLSLAIIDGLLVGIAENAYILPLSIVEECIEILATNIEEKNRKQMVRVRDELIPYINLRKMFGVEKEKPEYMKIAIINADGMRVGLLVDSIKGKYQTVIKSMGNLYKKSRHISGGTILGDGSVALILDTNQIIRIIEKEEAELNRSSARSH